MIDSNIPIRIGICGTHCAGKTTLVNIFKPHLSIPIILEIAAKYTIKEREEIDCQFEILKQQIKAETELGSFMSDRTVLDNLAYYITHPGYNEGHESEYMQVFEEHIGTRPYSLIFFLTEYFPLVENGTRDLNAVSQKKVFEFLSEELPQRCKQYNIKLVYLSGTRFQRIKTMMNAITNLENELGVKCITASPIFT